MKEEEWERSAMPTPSRGLVALMTGYGSLFLYILTAQKLGLNDKIPMLAFLIGLSITLTIFEVLTIEKVRK